MAYLDYIRANVPWAKDLDDASLVKEMSKATGKPLQEVAEYVGLPTGKNRNALMAGMSSGVDQLQGLGYSALAAGADIAGAKRVQDWAQRRADMNEIEATLAGRPDLEKVEDVWDKPGQWLPYAGYQIAKQVPQLGGSLALGAVAPQAVVPAALARGLAYVPRALGGGSLGAATTFGAQKAALQAGNTMGRQLLAGSGVGSVMGLGEMYGESVDAGDPNALGALAASPLYGLTEGLPQAVLGGTLAKSAYKGALPTRMAKAAGVNTLTGATSETVQNEMEMAFNPTLTPEEVASRRLNSAVAGGLAEGFIGSAGGFRNGNPRPPKVDPDNKTQETDLLNPKPTAPLYGIQRPGEIIPLDANVPAGPYNRFQTGTPTPQERSAYEAELAAQFDQPYGTINGETVTYGEYLDLQRQLQDMQRKQRKQAEKAQRQAGVTGEVTPPTTQSPGERNGLIQAVRLAFESTLPEGAKATPGSITKAVMSVLGGGKGGTPAASLDEVDERLIARIMTKADSRRQSDLAAAERDLQWLYALRQTPEAQQQSLNDFVAVRASLGKTQPASVVTPDGTTATPNVTGEAPVAAGEEPVGFRLKPPTSSDFAERITKVPASEQVDEDQIDTAFSLKQPLLFRRQDLPRPTKDNRRVVAGLKPQAVVADEEAPVAQREPVNEEPVDTAEALDNAEEILAATNSERETFEPATQATLDQSQMEQEGEETNSGLRVFTQEKGQSSIGDVSEQARQPLKKLLNTNVQTIRENTDEGSGTQQYLSNFIADLTEYLNEAKSPAARQIIENKLRDAAEEAQRRENKRLIGGKKKKKLQAASTLPIEERIAAAKQKAAEKKAAAAKKETTDAVQEPSAAPVDAQKQARDGEGMGSGDAQQQAPAGASSAKTQTGGAGQTARTAEATPATQTQVVKQAASGEVKPRTYDEVQVPFKAYLEEEGRYEDTKVSARAALASLKDDLKTMRALLNCVRGGRK